MEARKIYFLTCILSLLQSVNLLNCYICDALDQRSCHANQKQQKCSFKIGACLTMSYWFKKVTHGKRVVETAYKKQCVPTSTCQFFCKTRSILGYKDCKASCCRESLCNEEKKEKQMIETKVAKEKEKEQNEERTEENINDKKMVNKKRKTKATTFAKRRKSNSRITMANMLLLNLMLILYYTM